MWHFISPEAAVLMGLALLAVLPFLFLKGVSGMFKSRRGIAFQSPFIELDVKPVSEGDEIRYAYKLDSRYHATVRNKRKHAKLDLEADSIEELRAMIESTFKAWPIVGKKKEGFR